MSPTWCRHPQSSVTAPQSFQWTEWELTTSCQGRAMLSGLMDMEEGDRLLPFVRLFYSDPSTFLWDDEVGDTHEIRQGEGGEQGDALMPLLFSLGQHRALKAVARGLEEGERLFAFLDDLYVICRPARVQAGPPNHGAGVVGPRQDFIAQW